MPVVSNTVLGATGGPVRAQVTIRLIATDDETIAAAGYTGSGTIVAETKVSAGADGVWSTTLPANADILPANTYYQVIEQPARGRVVEHFIEVPDGAGPYDLEDILVVDPEGPDALAIAVTQKGAAGGVATLDANGLVPASQLTNAPGGTAASTVVAETSYGQASTAGVATTYSRGDHTHGTVGLGTTASTAAAGNHLHTGTYSPVGHAHAGEDITSGTLAVGRLPTGTSGSTVALGDHTHAGVYATAGHNHDGVYQAAGSYAAASHAHAGGDITSGTVAIGQLPTGTSSTTVALGDHTHSYQPLDSDLTAIAALSPSNDDVVQRKAGGWTNRTMAQVKTDLVLTKSDVGLGNVDNTSDAAKPVSTATQTALDTKPAKLTITSLKTGTYTATTWELVRCDASGGGFTITLPSAATATAGGTVVIRREEFGGNTITVQRAGSDTVAGGTSVSMVATESLVLVSDGISAWRIASSGQSLTGLDTRYTQRSTLTAKGDLYVATASGTIARQAVGTNNHVLMGDSTQTNGIKYAQITHDNVASANIDGVAATASMRTLGTGSQQAAAGNHTHAGGGATPVAFARVTSGNITSQNTGGAWQVLTGGPTISIAAATNDRLEFGHSGLLDPNGTFVDIAIVNGSTIIRYLSTATSSPSTEGHPALYPDTSFRTTGLAGFLTVEAGDIVGGNVTLAFVVKYSSSSAIIYASTDYPLHWWVKNLSAAP